MIAVILPVIDEYDNLKELIPAILSRLSMSDILIVIDGNHDENLWSSLGFKNDSRVRLLKQVGFGLGSALRQGMESATNFGAQKIVTMDADLSHDPKYLLKLIEACPEGGISIGSRYVVEGSFVGSRYRRFISKIANSLVRFTFRSKVKDLSSGYRCYDQGILAVEFSTNLNLSRHYAFQFDLLLRLEEKGCQTVEIPIVFLPRQGGKTKFGIGQLVSAALVVFKQKFQDQSIKRLFKGIALTIVIGLAVMAVLQIPNRGMLADPDGFYHAKVSQLIEHGQLTSSFPYLTYTTWKEGFADQHYLYHVLLIPFNNIDSLYLSVIVFALLFLVAFYFLLRKFGIRGRVWWIVLLLLGSTDFLFRINLVKANTLSLALLSLIMALVVVWQRTKNNWAAFGIAAASFLFVWTYGGFVFVPLVLGAYFLSVLIVERKLAAIPLIASAVGILLGLFLHPHSTNLLASLYNQIFLTGLGAGSQVPAGNEWLPYSWSWFLKSDIPILLAWILALVVACYEFYAKKINWESLWVNSVTVILFLLCMRHRRFIEYFVPFAVLASAISLSPYLIKLQWQQIKSVCKNHSEVGISLGLVIFTLGVALVYNFHNVDKYLAGESTGRFEQAAKLIELQSQPGDIVINTQWDQFPQLFYWNSSNYYPVGMDPTFMFIHDPDLYWKWRDVADDGKREWDSLAQLYSEVAQGLKAKYIFIDSNRNGNLSDYINTQDPEGQYFEKIYDDKEILIYKLK